MSILDLVSEIDETGGNGSLPATKEDKWEYCYVAHNNKGVPVKKLAAVFGVTPKTIRSWIQNYYGEYRQRYENLTRADMLAAELAWYEEMQRMFLEEAGRIDEDCIDIDKEGKFAAKDAVEWKKVKLNFMRSAMDARGARNQLLLKANVLPVEPERIYHSVSEDYSRDNKRKGTKKSPEELKGRIVELLENSRSITEQNR